MIGVWGICCHYFWYPIIMAYWLTFNYIHKFLFRMKNIGRREDLSNQKHERTGRIIKTIGMSSRFFFLIHLFIYFFPSTYLCFIWRRKCFIREFVENFSTLLSFFVTIEHFHILKFCVGETKAGCSRCGKGFQTTFSWREGEIWNQVTCQCWEYKSIENLIPKDKKLGKDYIVVYHLLLKFW